MSLEPIAQALKARGEKATAITMLEAFYRHAFHYEEYDDLAKTAFKIKEYTLAIKYGEDALSNALTNEKMWTGRSNLINVYNHANFPEKAIRLIKANEAVMPEDTDTRLEKAFSLYLLARRDEAEAILRNELLKVDLDEKVRTKILFNLGTYELYRDNFLYGLELFRIEGQRMDIWKKLELPGEFWMGQPAQGRDILVYAEAGIGDEIINVRFLKNLKDKGMNPIWFTERKDMGEIFRDSGFKVIHSLRERPADSLWTYSMTLPLYLEMDYAALWVGSYITCNTHYVEKHSSIKKPGLNIGIRWQGNPEYDHDLHRSVGLSDVINCIPENTNLVSLQRDTGLDELEDYPQILDMSSKMTDFRETLGIISNLDVVVTTCTSVAHAAAAMGKRTFIFVPISAYYIWSHSTKQSPWYGDNVTLLRQVKPRDWAAPMAELKQLLAEL